ncbi:MULTISPECIES: DUF6270 domain-containing protein [Pseudomonas]|uniref:DUF6270 domain-containing protein n=1 Tax=Pseudomonas capeferrum TaxID=1495066 RepID=A0ABY7RCS1_9PSED|nr:DUF6270 domain-containing protein [Pseudomonas capeferrum]KGI94732.1 hypothetical protein MD26_04420 [Pseudomonas sp. H2]MUT51899.1 hypothetical protein [Pseudomonas sp. TDA1]WCI01581.1 DUF6270 domain-containing protein [Pseudomonas capeferrum]
MIKNLLIYGSCVSRDIFNLEESRDFKLTDYYARSSMASLSSEAYENDHALSHIPSAFRRRMVACDFSKEILSAKDKFSTADVILIDLIDERFDLISLPSGQLLTNSNELAESALLKDDSVLGYTTIKQGTPERRELWLQGMRKFFEFLKEIDKLDQVIINKVFWSSKFENEADIPFPVAQPFIEKANQELSWMYEALRSVLREDQFLDFSPSLLTADEQHRWGPSPFHYCKNYYREALAQIIIKAMISSETTEHTPVAPHSPLVSSGVKLNVAAYRTNEEIFAHCTLAKNGSIHDSGCFAFYLVVNGARHEVRWYDTSPNARFEVPDQSSSLEIVAFYKDILEDQMSARCTVKLIDSLQNRNP